MTRQEKEENSKKSFSFTSSLSKEEIKKLMNSVSWYHTFEINGERQTETRTSLKYQMWVAQGIPEDLSGKTVLDIGTADGFYSFLAEHRGAKRVLALDYMKFPGFDIAKKILNSNVEHRFMIADNLEQLDEKFDIILFFGVYYHLVNPVSVIQKILSKVNDRVFLSGPIIDTKEPLMCYYDENEMHHNDSSNWWVASPSCIIQMGKRIGFNDVKHLDSIFQVEMINSQTKDSREGLRKLGNIGIFELIK